MYKGNKQELKKKYTTSVDPKTDKLLELLIDWLDSVIFALQLIDPDEKVYDYFWSKQRDTAEIPTDNQEYFGAQALIKLTDMLIDLRNRQNNIILDRYLKNKKGRPRDSRKSIAIKNEAARLYKYLSEIDKSSPEACGLINLCLQFLELPLMSPEAIRKRSYKVSGYPNALALQKSFRSDNKPGSTCALHSKHHYEAINLVICIISLNNIAQKPNKPIETLQDFIKSALGK